MLRRMRPLLGTYVEVGLYLQTNSHDDPESAFTAAFQAIEAIQRSLSFHDPDSELSQLNRSDGHAIRLSSLALRVLRLARGMTAASNGLFNCTIGGALIERGRLPNHGGVQPALVGEAQDIEIYAGSARLRRPLRITLDGIAKGYAVDLASIALRRHGIHAGWVNAGGDIRAFGDCTLPIQHRHHGTDATRFGLRNAALASSSSNEQYDPALPGEILAASTLQSVTGNWCVMAAQAWRADALTKVAALAPRQCDALLQRLGGRRVLTDLVLAA
ncbi:MAG: FAD:protein FMN transferase [Steroidobacteraceae bacterium]